MDREPTYDDVTKRQLWDAVQHCQRMFGSILALLDRDWSAEKKITLLQVMMSQFRKGTDGQEPGTEAAGQASEANGTASD